MPLYPNWFFHNKRKRNKQKKKLKKVSAIALKKFEKKI